MEISGVVERVQRVSAVRGDTAAGRSDLEDALRAVGQLQSWLTGAKAALTSRLAAQVSFPEQALAECTRGSGRDAIEDKERADTLDRSDGLAAALDDATVTAGHVDEVTRAIKNLEGEQRDELFDRLENNGLLDVAAVASVEDWRKRLALEVRNIQRDDGMARLERQRRAARLRTWTDADGMWCISGRFDPVTGVRISAKLDAAVEALFAEATADTCPSDPVEKQHHLQALAFAAIVDGTTGTGRPARPEFVVVIDTSTSDGAGGPSVDWGLPVEIPHRVLADLAGDADTHVVVVRNGVILHAPGELNLGRSTRLANRAQRRALRAMYSTCAVPGCRVSFDRCKIHHITWWRNGGTTDLSNLLPVCSHHHTRIHDHGWDIGLGPNRELTIRFPDGTERSTGPPTRAAA